MGPAEVGPPAFSTDVDEQIHPAVRLTGVARTYPGPPPVPALLPLHVTVERGDYVAIVGPSGSGKSTFLNVVGLLDTPTEGIYELDGIDVGALSERDRAALRGCRIGFVFQEFRLLSHRTATENVALAQLYNGTPRRDRMQAAAQALDQVGLSHRRQAVPSTLSGGERQRVAIARALVNRPSLRSPEVGRARLLKSCGFDSVDDRAWVAEHGRRVCVEFVGE